MNNNYQPIIKSFLMNTAMNVLNDASQDSMTIKLTRAALNSVPSTIAFDTTALVDYVADRLAIPNVQQQSSLQDQFFFNTSGMSFEEYLNRNRIIAYYSHPDFFYKNF